MLLRNDEKGSDLLEFVLLTSCLCSSSSWSNAKLAPSYPLAHHNADYQPNHCSDTIKHERSKDTRNRPCLPRPIPIQWDHDRAQPGTKDRHHSLAIKRCLRVCSWAKNIQLEMRMRVLIKKMFLFWIMLTHFKKSSSHW